MKQAHMLPCASRQTLFLWACGGFLLLATSLLTGTASGQDFGGSWTLIEERSTEVDPWRNLRIETLVEGPAVTIRRIWSGNREAGTYVDAVTVPADAQSHPVRMEQWPDNRHLGAFLGSDSTRHVRAEWIDDGRTLRMESTLPVSTSQGERTLRIYTEYRLSPDSDVLEVIELRSTRPRPVHYTFRRVEG